MDQWLQFITDHQRGFYAMTELCALTHRLTSHSCQILRHAGDLMG